MLSKQKIESLKERLMEAINPVFLFDNDTDGLCSYILLRRFLGKGKGVAIRTHPGIDPNYVKRAVELGADLIVVLDKPILGKEFVEAAKDNNLSVLWIDHHDTDEQYEGVEIYNPTKEKKKSNEPVTYICYTLSGRDEDIWIAIMGCISDHFLPSFSEDFEMKYPEMWGKVKNPFDAYYETDIGLLARALNFGLKDSLTHVVGLQNYLIICQSPQELLKELEGNSAFGMTYRSLRKKYDSLMEEAKNLSGKLIFFSYGGETSMSSDIANELCYRNPKNYVAVAYMKEGICNISLRGKGIKKIIEKILPSFPNSTGGGHEDAVGVRLQRVDLERFKEAIQEELA